MMDQEKSLETIRKHLISAVKEASKNENFDEIKMKIKQTIRLIEDLEKTNLKNKKKIENKKKIKANSDPRSILKFLNNQISQEKDKIEEFQKNMLAKEKEDIQTFLD